MKKLILLMLVAMVPYFTMAQKRSKKEKKAKTEKVFNADASYKFMVITGMEISRPPAKEREVKKELMIIKSKVVIQFDFGNKKDADKDLVKNSRSFTSMVAAVNAAANNGWEFISSDVIVSGASKIHYYYMRKDK